MVALSHQFVASYCLSRYFHVGFHQNDSKINPAGSFLVAVIGGIRPACPSAVLPFTWKLVNQTLTEIYANISLTLQCWDL